MKIVLLLIGFSVIIFSCKKEPQLNDGIHDDLVETKLSKDSLQKMDVILDKLNKKNATFLDYYFHNYYELEKEINDEIRKSKGEDFTYQNENDAYSQLYTKLAIQKGDQYLKILGMTEEEEHLALEVYILHLKQRYGPTIDGRLQSLDKQ